MIKTFADAVKFLEKYIPTPEKKHPGQLGLVRMQYLIDLFGNPQLAYPTIHVGGTSGKGSTATIIASILSTNYKVGLHTSPHLVRVTERIKIMKPYFTVIPNGVRNLSRMRDLKQVERFLHSPVKDGIGWNDNRNNIPGNEFVELLDEMLPVIKKVEKSEFEKPSYFEIITALTFLYFRKQKVDVAVIEVGMGGRFDGTNVIKPIVAVLTNVGLDHTEVLGNTVEEIAKDKVGIIKSGIKVVSAVKQPSVIDIINAKCKMKNAKLSLLSAFNTPSHRESHGFLRQLADSACHSRCGFGAFYYRIVNISEKGSVFDYFGEKTCKNLRLSLLGQYQIENASLAIRAIECLNATMQPRQRRGNNATIKIGEAEIRRGLICAYIPGRLEIIKRNPLVILDGAHNSDKVKALVSSIKTIFPKKKVTAIIAIKKDKNAKEMLETFIRICQKVIFTRFKLISDQGVISSFEPEELLKIATNIGSFTPGESLRNTPGVVFRLTKNTKEALRLASKEARKDDLILVTGSLYLIGEVKKNLELRI